MFIAGDTGNSHAHFFSILRFHSYENEKSKGDKVCLVVEADDVHDGGLVLTGWGVTTGDLTRKIEH